MLVVSGVIFSVVGVAWAAVPCDAREGAFTPKNVAEYLGNSTANATGIPVDTVEVRLRYKNPDFLVQNPDFLLKNANLLFEKC